MEDKPLPSDSQPIERRLATIMMADVAGYSRMMGENEERTLAILRGHREVFDALLKAHRGRVFNTAGDAILAEFASAVEAVRCATEIQTALRTRNEHLAPEQRMWFRIGINLGDIIVQGTDLLGDGVNVAARVQTIAEPGGICISGSVYDQIENKLTLQIRRLGEKTFKNIAKPIRVFSISDDAVDVPATNMRSRDLHKGRRVPVVTMVIVAGLVAGAAGGYWLYRDYSLRLVEETRRTEEAKRAADLQLKAEEEKAAEADREAKLLGEQSAKDAQAQAEASRRKAEAAQPETRLQREPKSAKDLTPQQVSRNDDVRNCAVKCYGNLSIPSCTRAIESGKLSTAALATAYLNRAVALLPITGASDRAMADFDAAIKLDPKQADAYIYRGELWKENGNLTRARADFVTAARLNPKLIDDLAIQGKPSYGDPNRRIDWRDLDAVIETYDGVIRVDPTDKVAYTNRGVAWREKRDWGRAIADFDAAIKLDPKNYVAYTNRGIAWTNQGDWDRAIADFDAAIEHYPDYWMAYINRGLAWAKKGDLDRASADVGAAIKLYPGLICGPYGPCPASSLLDLCRK